MRISPDQQQEIDQARAAETPTRRVVAAVGIADADQDSGAAGISHRLRPDPCRA